MLKKLKKILELYKDGILFSTLFHSGPFQLSPKAQTDDYSHSHLHKGFDYHQRFHTKPGRKLIWELEQEILLKIIKDNNLIKTHLDFAGGTGRIALLLEDCCDEQYILDISEKMLLVARENLPKANIICADFKLNPSELANKEFDLITAFRFFPNSELKLRESAMKYIAHKLTNGGYLICNNHRNFWSIPYFTQRLFFSGGSTGMSNEEMMALATRCGLKLVRTYSMGIIPQTEDKAIIPWLVTEHLEKWFFRKMGTWHRKGYDVIYVFEKK